MKKILFITDTWSKTENKDGVVTWLRNIKIELEKLDHEVTIIDSSLFINFPLPWHKEVIIPIFTRRKLKNILLKGQHDIVHISTEGVLGLVSRNICNKYKIKYSTYYHTKFPEYLDARIKILKQTAYSYLKWFHKKSSTIFVSTETLKNDLIQKGFNKNIVVNPLGVDTKLFKRNLDAKLPNGLTKPIFTYLGRLAPEKNIEAFLKCNLPGTKLVIGSGPDFKRLKEQYTQNTVFVGRKEGQGLVDLLSLSAVLVFPSLTDTFGLVILEAMACGVPVASYEVAGPKDIITNGKDGYCGENLEKNILDCLKLKPEGCIYTASKYTWAKTANNFLVLAE